MIFCLVFFMILIRIHERKVGFGYMLFGSATLTGTQDISSAGAQLDAYRNQ